MGFEKDDEEDNNVVDEDEDDVDVGVDELVLILLLICKFDEFLSF